MDARNIVKDEAPIARDSCRAAARAFLLACALLGASAGSPARALEFVSPNEETGGVFGNSVAGLDDLNGDGFGEILIGASGETVPSVGYAGRAYIMDGFSGATLATIDSPNPVIDGLFGFSASTIPDITGDGNPDIAIGAAGEIGPSFLASGRVYLYEWALPPVFLRTLDTPSGEDQGFFGGSVSGIPDVDGDNLGDVVVGAEWEDGSAVVNSGRAYIFSGATGALLWTLLSPNPEAFGGVSPYDYSGVFGFRVSGISDLDVDGRGDVIVGAFGEDFGGTRDSGRAYVFSGATGALLRSVNSPNVHVSGLFGVLSAGLPDVNGDSRGDYVIGAPGDSTGASPQGSGRVYIFSGATGGLLRTLQSPNEETVTGANYPGYFGFFGQGVGDLTGDGRGDVLVGAPWEDPGAAPQDCGRAYIFSGADGALRATLASPFQATFPLGSFGFASAFAAVPDISGDGMPDVVVGSYNEIPNGPIPDSGRAYTYNGFTGGYILPNAVADWRRYE